MKVIKHVGPTCRCLDRLAALEATFAGRGHALHIGSVVECECGQQYVLTDSQRDGPYWAQVSRVGALG